MAKVRVYSLDGGSGNGDVELPPVFSTPVRRDLIAKAYIHLESHRFQPKGTHPTAGMDVVAKSNDPPTGRGVSRIAKMRGGGGGRQGQAGGVASVRGGRQAHPPKVAKVIYKKLNKKENRLALCSAIAATASRELVMERGHRIGGGGEGAGAADGRFPIVVSDDIESVSRTRELVGVIDALGLAGDVDRLRARKARTGKPALRGRGKKTGRSVLFVTGSSADSLRRAAGTIPGAEARSVDELSVLDLAPGSTLARLVVYSRSAIQKIGDLRSPHLELMAKVGEAAA